MEMRQELYLLLSLLVISQFSEGRYRTRYYTKHDQWKLLDYQPPNILHGKAHIPELTKANDETEANPHALTNKLIILTKHAKENGILCVRGNC